MSGIASIPRPTSIETARSGEGSLSGADAALIEHERNIFMRASLQLLDRGEAAAHSSRMSPVPGSSARASSDHGSKSILKAGLLKKASGNKLAHGGWKPKYVEIRHGDFVYEDDASGWGEIGKKKTISLIADRCRCRNVKKRSDATLFELTEYGGIRRLWRASTPEERDAWVHAINAAMVGSAGDFEGDDAGVVFSPSPGKYSPRTPKAGPSFGGLPRSGSKKAVLSAEAALLLPYTEGIDRFVSTRESVYRSSSAEEYRRLLDSFTTSQTPFVIPVGFAKSFGKKPEMRRQSSHIISNQTSQVWKDMCRDVIVINGVRFTGIESIICGLVRTLVDCAERIRLLQVQRQQMDSSGCRSDIDLSHFRKGVSFRDSILGITGMGDSSLGLMFHEESCPLFDLNEGQILACAKDILYACNRTHSGGDTYDCVNSMICHDTFAVLTPFDTEAEPMEIRIDVIQREHSRGVVHNAWLDRSLAPNSVDAKVASAAAAAVHSDSEMPPRPRNTDMLSPFRRLGGNRKAKKKDKRISDPGSALSYQGSTTPPTPVNGKYDDGRGDAASTPAGSQKRNHKRSETNSTASSVPTPRQPYFNRDYDENTSDDEPAQSKKNSEWHNPASTTHDFSQPLGIGDKSPNLPPPTLTNVYRDKWGTSLSSFPDESSIGSSTGGATSVSSSDNSTAIRTRVKAMFSKRPKSTTAMQTDKSYHFFGESKKMLDGSEVSEEDSSKQKSVSMTTHATASSGINSVPSLALHTVHLDDEGGIRKVSSSRALSPAENIEISTTPRKVVNVEDISSCGDEEGRRSEAAEDNDLSPSVVSSRTRFIKDTHRATEITDRPMCIRVEVRAKSRYKICSMDPQGEGDDTWASVSGIFQQLFYLKAFCNGKASVSDKVVSINFDAMEKRKGPI